MHIQASQCGERLKTAIQQYRVMSPALRNPVRNGNACYGLRIADAELSQALKRRTEIKSAMAT
ncbi:hypothetical protein WK53_13740 [Burkholderia ubonensis]|uniref:Uncharacterized protein n=1 Tax=Burkholderia ubonensis TaxID=101571 RepID=A0AAW3N4E4_9BURK|nr:hypothetical protein WK53_13740 [Burkholderia ubonensis]